jgi:hypothetical protein
VDIEQELTEYRQMQRRNRGEKPAAQGRVRRRGEHKEGGEDLYTVVCRKDFEAFIRDVNYMLDDGGWKPLGGVAVVKAADEHGNEAIYYFQALIEDEAWGTDEEEAQDANPVS